MIIYDIHESIYSLDDEGNHVEPNELGNLVVKLPLPPGCFPTLYQNPKKYVSSYFSRFPGFYETSDSGVIGIEFSFKNSFP